MKKIRQNLTVGQPKKGLDLYCSLSLDGNQVRRFRSKSFLGPYAYMLHAHFHGGSDKKIGIRNEGNTLQGSSNNTIYSGTVNSITAVSTDTPARVTLSNSSLLTDMEDFVSEGEPSGNMVYIVNAVDAGLYRAKQGGTTSQFDLFHLDGTPVNGAAVDLSGGRCVPNIGFVTRSIRNSSSSGGPGVFMSEILQNWQIITGRSAQPVSVQDFYLWDRIPPGSSDNTLNHGTLSVSPLTTDKPTSRFTMSKAFTNQGTTDVSINEIGIQTMINTQSIQEDADSQGFTIVRDVLAAPLLIAAGKTLTVDYELVVRLEPDTQNTDLDGTNGGFLQSFMSLLREIAANNDTAGRNSFFNCGFGGGTTSYSRVGSSVQNADRYGVRLGPDNTFVSMTDESLNLPNVNNDGFSHGEGLDENGIPRLWYHGMNFEPVVYDLVNDKATFIISRIFQNRSGGAVDVKEIGLFGASANSFGVGSPQLLARTALAPADQFSVANGAYIEVQYQVEVQA